MDVKVLAKCWADGGWDGEDARRHLKGVLEDGPPFQLRARDRQALAFLIAEGASVSAVTNDCLNPNKCGEWWQCSTCEQRPGGGAVPIDDAEGDE